MMDPRLRAEDDGVMFAIITQNAPYCTYLPSFVILGLDPRIHSDTVAS